uniref:Protein phosphatase 1 regulatory subunit 15A/B C-terminal domain-containing protein n=1 Tax=Nothobranchius furzeri TaxID=105023 RepID=A0A8C6P5Q9_NOTFU
MELVCTSADAKLVQIDILQSHVSLAIAKLLTPDDDQLIQRNTECQCHCSEFTSMSELLSCAFLVYWSNVPAYEVYGETHKDRALFIVVINSLKQYYLMATAKNDMIYNFDLAQTHKELLTKLPTDQIFTHTANTCIGPSLKFGINLGRREGAMLGPLSLHTCAWVACESDWDSSASTSPDVDEDENDRLWDSFSKVEDPYNLMRFTSTLTTAPNQSELLPVISSTSATNTETKESNLAQWADGKTEMFLNPFSRTGSLYGAVNTQTWPQTVCTTTRAAVTIVNAKQHNHLDRTLVTWKRAMSTLSRDESIKSIIKHKTVLSSTVFHVHFSPLVQIHVMHTWSFARNTSRKGQWEEQARDRDRFRQRIVETERVVGNCFTPLHREKMRRFLAV